MRFHTWEAAIAAGATLEELYLIDGGDKDIDWHKSKWFKLSLVAWHRAKMQVEKHSVDATIKKPKKGK